MRYGNKIIQGNTSPHQTKAGLIEQIKTMNHNYQVLHEQHERGYTYSIKTIRDLESKLEIARKALKELWQATHYDTDGYLGKTIQHALEQITHDNSEKPNSQEHKE